MYPVIAAVKLVYHYTCFSKASGDELPLSSCQRRESVISTKGLERRLVVEWLVGVVQFAPAVVAVPAVVFQMFSDEFIRGCVHHIDELALEYHPLRELVPCLRCFILRNHMSGVARLKTGPALRKRDP